MIGSVVDVAESEQGGVLKVVRASFPGLGNAFVLESDGALLSALLEDGDPSDPVFEYCRSFDCMFDPERSQPPARGPVLDVLMLGGGGFSYPRRIMLATDEVRVDVVEIDRSVIDLARRYFGLDALERNFGSRASSGFGPRHVVETDPHASDGLSPRGAGRLKVIHSDALSYMRRCGKLYDAVVDDTFVGRMHDPGMSEEDGIRLAASLLKPGGMFLVNVSCDSSQSDHDDAEETLHIAVNLMFGIFRHIHAVPCDDELFGSSNLILIGTDSEYSFEGEVPW